MRFALEFDNALTICFLSCLFPFQALSIAKATLLVTLNLILFYAFYYYYLCQTLLRDPLVTIPLSSAGFIFPLPFIALYTAWLVILGSASLKLN
jgi:hypothetical protein